LEKSPRNERIGTADYAAPMRNRVVPHFGHLPFIAGFPFFSFTFFGSDISRFARHFTQYAWTMGGSPGPAQHLGPDKYMGVAIFRHHGVAGFASPRRKAPVAVFIDNTYIMKP